MGELMRSLKGYRYLNEPFMHTPLRKRTYIGPGENAPREVHEWVKNALQGDIYDFWRWNFKNSTSIGRAWEFATSRKVAVKFTRALRMLGWIQSTFDVRGTILLIRHPCAVVSSMLHHGGWDDNHMRNQGESVSDRILGRNLPQSVIERFESSVHDVENRYEMLAHLWGLDYYMACLHDQPSPPSWILVPYERIVTREREELYRIANALGVQVNDAMRERLRVPSSSTLAGANTNQREQQLRKWKSHLSEEESARILSIVHQYGFDMYTDEPEPTYSRLRALQNPDFRFRLVLTVLKSRSTMPDVSVVIPTYNRLNFLKKAIASCFEGNDEIDVEVIVVDDGSTDGTREWLLAREREEIRPLLRDHEGAQQARNAGMKVASGQFMKFLDDDDWLAKGALAAEVTHLRSAEADVSHGRLRTNVEDGTETGAIVPEDSSGDIIVTVFAERMWTVPHKYLFRHSSIQSVTWDPTLPYHQDYAFLIDTACRGLSFSTIDRVVGVSRQHNGPRINTTKELADRATYYGLKVGLIKRGIKLLESRNLLCRRHCRAAAQAIWKWAHIVAAYDMNAFDQFYADIQRIDPGFVPQRSRTSLAMFDFILGVKNTERLLHPLRRLKNVTHS